MDKYLNGEDLTEDELRSGIRKGCLAPDLHAHDAAAPPSRTRASSPCSTRWSATCPARWTCAAIKGVDTDGNEVERQADDKEPFAALIFKIMADPFVGSLAFIRVYSGVLAAGSGV